MQAFRWFTRRPTDPSSRSGGVPRRTPLMPKKLAISQTTTFADGVGESGQSSVTAHGEPGVGSKGSTSCHAITEGRGEKERVNLLRSFTGQSLKGPEGSIAILSLAETATDSPSYEAQTSVSAAGRAQAVALKFGKGRVLVQGEAAMLSAQIAGQEKRRMGMNVPGNDNRQYTLNLMHWLSGLIK